MLGILCTLVVLIHSAKAEGEATEALEKVQAAVDVGNAILEVFTDDDTTKFLTHIGEFAKQITPFLGAIGPIISIITMFLPQGDSPELQYMKEQFAKVDAKFDEVFYKFGQLENLLMETSIKCQYSEYVLTIRSLSNKLSVFLDQPFENAHTFKDAFISEYENTYGGATWKLFDGMMRSSSLSDNIPFAAMKYTDNHRRKTQQIMKGIVNLIMQGIKVEIAYKKFKGNENGTIAVQTYWEGEMETLLEHVKAMDYAVTEKWYSEFSDNIDDKLATLYELNNKDFASQLYSFLSEKFDWRDWHVVAYNELWGYEEHTFKTGCSGYNSLRKHGRNLLVASVDKSQDPMIQNMFFWSHFDIYTEFWLVPVEKCTTSVSTVCNDIGAKEVYNNLPAKYRIDCTYPSFGVLEKSADIAHNASDNRLITTTNGRYQIFLFG